MNSFQINATEVQSKKAELEHQYGSELIVPGQIQVLHPLLKNVKTRLDDYAKRYSNELISASRGQVDIIVSPKNVSKALRFVDSFLKFAEKRNHRIVVHDKKTCLIIQGEEIQFKFRERASRSDTPSKYGLHELIPTGLLYFKIETLAWSREFTNEKVPLEDQLAFIMAYVEVKGKLLFDEHQHWRSLREQDEKKRQIELEKRKKVDDELSAFKKLHSLAMQWRDAKMIRDYVAAVESNSNENGLTDETQFWIEWAKKKANWFDPLVKGSDDLLQEIDAGKVFNN